jgi:hypothetical protein
LVLKCQSSLFVEAYKVAGHLAVKMLAVIREAIVTLPVSLILFNHYAFVAIIVFPPLLLIKHNVDWSSDG